VAAPLAAALGAAAKQLGKKILVDQALRNGRIWKLVAVASGVVVLVPVLVVLVFAAIAMHVMQILHAQPTVRLAIDAYRAAEECPFASDSTYGKALGTAYLLASAMVLTGDNVVEWGAYKNHWDGSQVSIPADMLKYTDPAELLPGGSVHDEIGLHGDFHIADWTTVLGWVHWPIVGWVPDLINPPGGEHGVGFLLMMPSSWRAWVQEVPDGLPHQLDPYRPYDSFLVMACHLKHTEDRSGLGLAGTVDALAAFGDDSLVELVNIVADAAERATWHLSDIVKALAALITGNGEAFANAVRDFMGLTPAFTGQFQPSPIALHDIPHNYLTLILHWAARFGIDWSILAGVLKVECDFGRFMGGHCVSPAGAEGPAQFLPRTFAIYHLPGMDNIWSPNDSIAAAARYLNVLGVNQDPTRALCAYNGAGGQTCGYADQVMTFAIQYRGAPAGAPAGSPGSAAGVAIRAAMSAIGTPYVWGGDRPGGFDCSGLVQWAYAQAGIQLPRTAAEQYAAGPRLSPGQQLEPGDLVFFIGADGTPTSPGHVGIALTANQMIDAPHQGADVQIESFGTGAGWGYIGATRPSAR
jgi:cell wall-associated NlpC family hydrolase